MHKIEVSKDGFHLNTIEGENVSDVQTKAFGYMLRCQPNSVDHALRYEGYKVKEIYEDGEVEYWKYYTRKNK